MKMETVGRMVNIRLDEGDVYEGHEQTENGSGMHKFLVNGALPMVIIKHFGQIVEVFDHDGWEIEQITPGDGRLIKVPPIEVWGQSVKRDGLSLREAREPIPYTPLTSMTQEGKHEWR